MERAAFLARVRDRLGDAPRLDAAVPRGWAVDVGDPVARFETELAAVHGHAHRATPVSSGDVLASIVAGRDGPVLVTRDDAVPSGARAAVARAGGHVLEWPEAGRDGAARAEVGVAGGLVAIAETGSVVVSSAPPGGRAPTLLPPAIVLFVPVERLVPTVADAFAAIGAMDEYPSNLVVVTGPSSSGDIGLQLVRGVHGPGEVHVVLVDG